MADYYYGKIEIPRKYAEMPEIREKLEKQFKDVNVDICLGFHAPASDKVLEFADNGARYGEFPGLEKFLVEHKIPFDRYSTSYYEFEPKVASYRPERGNMIISAANLDGKRPSKPVTCGSSRRTMTWKGSKGTLMTWHPC